MEPLTQHFRETLKNDYGRQPTDLKAVVSTGMNAAALHTMSQELVEGAIKIGVRELIKGGDCTVIILGCAGMAGFDST